MPFFPTGIACCFYLFSPLLSPRQLLPTSSYSSPNFTELLFSTIETCSSCSFHASSLRRNSKQSFFLLSKPKPQPPPALLPSTKISHASNLKPSPATSLLHAIPTVAASTSLNVSLFLLLLSPRNRTQKNNSSPCFFFFHRTQILCSFLHAVQPRQSPYLLDEDFYPLNEDFYPLDKDLPCARRSPSSRAGCHHTAVPLLSTTSNLHSSFHAVQAAATATTPALSTPLQAAEPLLFLHVTPTAALHSRNKAIAPFPTEARATLSSSTETRNRSSSQLLSSKTPPAEL